MDRRVARALTATVAVGLGGACVFDWGPGPAPPRHVPPEISHVAPPETAPPVAVPVASPPSSEACGTYLDDPEVDRPNLTRVVWARAAHLTARLHLTLEDEAASTPLRMGVRASLGEHAEPRRALRLLSAASDRYYGGVDHLAAASTLMGYRALVEHDDALALELAHVAERADPSDALPHVIEAIASWQLGAPSADAMSRAFQLEPDEPAIALTTYFFYRDSPEMDVPLRALDAYLRVFPEDATLSRDRATLSMRHSIFGDARMRERDGVRVLGGSSGSLTELALELEGEALWDAATALRVGRPEALTLWIYPTRASFLRAHCERPQTLALFDGTGIHLDEPALLQLDEARTSLRHESVHAVLASLTRRAPGWFDEGVAQYVAGEDRLGKRFEPLTRLRTWIPMASMNGPLGAIDDPTDARLAYGQALAMVLYLVDRRGEESLGQAAHYLNEGGDPDHLLEAMGAPLDGPTLLAFLDQRTPEPDAGTQ